LSEKHECDRGGYIALESDMRLRDIVVAVPKVLEILEPLTLLLLDAQDSLPLHTSTNVSADYKKKTHNRL